MPIKNPERRRRQQAAWRAKNPNYARDYYRRTKTTPDRGRVSKAARLLRCREYQRRVKREMTPEELVEHQKYQRRVQRRYREKARRDGRLWLARAIRSARRRARKKGIECTITSEDLSMPTVCPVFGIPIDTVYGTPAANRPSLDRVDNTKGYVVGNVMVISWRANTRKSDMSISELRALLAYMEAAEMLGLTAAPKC